MARKSNKLTPMKFSDLHKQTRKPVAPPSQILGEHKRKNAYKRREKHKKNFED